MLSDCIEHKQKGLRRGYGRTHRKIDGVYQFCMLHRAVFYDHNVYLPEVVRHKCDNPRCINPEHLEAGTVQDNVNDRVSRGRGAKGESMGASKLTEEQVRYIRKVYTPGDRQRGVNALARQLGVSAPTVHSIVLGKTWKHVE